MNVKWLLKKIGTTIYNNRSNIEFVAGAALTVVGTGMIISKAEEAVEVKGEMENAIKVIELTDEADGWDSDSQRTKACLDMARRTVCGYGKVYGPGIAVEVTGLVLMGISHATDRAEVVSKTAALSSLALEYANYRKRVIEDQGEAKDEEYRFGKPEVIVNEDGTTTTKPVNLEDKDIVDRILFDEVNPNFSKEPRANYDYLSDNQRWLDEKLWVEGSLTVNEIRKYIKTPASKKAAEGDWGITAVDDEGNRQHINFHIDDDTEYARAFRNGEECSFMIKLDHIEPNITTKLYRLNKYHSDVIISQ